MKSLSQHTWGFRNMVIYKRITSGNKNICLIKDGHFKILIRSIKNKKYAI